MIGKENKNEIIRLFHVHRYYGKKKALVDITLDITKNDFVFISGPSGAGKTTLLKLLYLEERADMGHVLVDGINLSRIKKRNIAELRRKFGVIFQDYKLIPTKTVYENIALVLEAIGNKSRQIPKKIRSVLRTVGMEDRIDAYPMTLSGGEQQRVAVARAVSVDPEIILADEPTGNLDTESSVIILDLLNQFHNRGATVIVATHDMDLIRQKGGRIVNLKEGYLKDIILQKSCRNQCVSGGIF
ncbi:MAG: cell division ATP-binding protein FtsE [Desulfobacterales bacterium]